LAVDAASNSKHLDCICGVFEGLSSNADF
jgi:hypothetical protein